MNLKIFIAPVLFLFVSSYSITSSNKETKMTVQRAPVRCMENSPERRGQEGCTILTNRPLQRSPTKDVYWHIDRFDSLEKATKAAGVNGVAAEAHGSFWLMTVESKSEDHHGGHHVAWIGPLTLPTADQYSMRVLSSLLMPGSTTPIHTHSGPEAFYIVDGKQCIETEADGKQLVAGQTYMVPGGAVHRGRVIGSTARRALALNLYDAAYPVSQDLHNPHPWFRANSVGLEGFSSYETFAVDNDLDRKKYWRVENGAITLRSRR
jgi:quercetin dioxygenase-like cupin family protein